MYKIGLSGGICTGKSLILNILRELGCYTVRADDLAKSIIFGDNPRIRKELIKIFGPDIYDEKNGLKKETFSRILFEDEEKRNCVNKMVHPLVKAERAKLIKKLEESKLYDFLIYESALLVEAGIYKEFDKIIIAYSTPEEQIARLMQRDGIGLEEAENKIKSQFPLSEKLKVAHYTIDTSGSFENTRLQTLETFYLLKKDLKI
ncbi:MAG TPA: dephospho-CoA kinase [Candidatus Kapabacteria bacterium]|nr:dephospho-CoA kinase [Candidatus Kapabacteria bacterium]